MKIYKYINDMYPRELWITFGATENELNNQFYAYVDGQPRNDLTLKLGNGYDGLTFYGIADRKTDKLGILINFTNVKNTTINTMAHESFHALDDMMESCGLEYIQKDCANEHLAYLLGWIMQSVDAARQQENKRLKTNKKHDKRN